MDDKTERNQRFTIAGALLAAVAASSCCLGPVALAALGIGGVGAFATLAAYRPYILIVTVALLGAGFFLTYRRPKALEGEACDCARPASRRAGKIGLWIATALVAIFAASPTLIARTAGAAAEARAPAVTTQSATLRVLGANCEACAVHMRKELAQVGGLTRLELDVENETVRLQFEPAEGRLAAYVARLNAMGYEARVLDSPANKPPRGDTHARSL